MKLVDGSTVSMPDTAENQDVYPQHGAQKEGLGFPIARIVVLLSLATAMASDILVLVFFVPWTATFLPEYLFGW